MNKYIKLLVESIINEARILRTIDKKLWLSVASTISRNKATQAEFIKPIGSDKDNMLQRYVAALLITKKPCPQTEEEIEKLKTYKLVAQKALALGATLSDILSLYDLNSGTLSSGTTNTTTKTEVIEPVEPVEPEEPEVSNNSFNSIFDDDIFGYDDNEEIGNMLETLPFNASLSTVLQHKLDILKPNGFKLAASTDDSYEYFYRSIYYSDAFTRNIKTLLKNNNWIEYTFPQFGQKLLEFLRTHQDITIEELKELKASLAANSYTEWHMYNNIIEYIGDYNNIREEAIKKQGKYLLEYFNKYHYEIVYILVSPDNGLIYFEIDNIKTNTWRERRLCILTFTGQNNYHELLYNSKNKQLLKDIKLQNSKKYNFRKFITKYNGLKSFTKTLLIDYDDYPYLKIDLWTNAVIKVLTQWSQAGYYEYNNSIYSKKFIHYYYIVDNNDKNDRNSVIELQSANNPYIRIYGYDGENPYALVKLTPEGKEKFDELYGYNK